MKDILPADIDGIPYLASWVLSHYGRQGKVPAEYKIKIIEQWVKWFVKDCADKKFIPLAQVSLIAEIMIDTICRCDNIPRQPRKIIVEKNAGNIQVSQGFWLAFLQLEIYGCIFASERIKLESSLDAILKQDPNRNKYWLICNDFFQQGRKTFGGVDGKSDSVSFSNQVPSVVDAIQIKTLQLNRMFDASNAITAVVILTFPPSMYEKFKTVMAEDSKINFEEVDDIDNGLRRVVVNRCIKTSDELNIFMAVLPKFDPAIAAHKNDICAYFQSQQPKVAVSKDAKMGDQKFAAAVAGSNPLLGNLPVATGVKVELSNAAAVPNNTP